jgi:hypothetical protein
MQPEREQALAIRGVSVSLDGGTPHPLSSWASANDLSVGQIA